MIYDKAGFIQNCNKKNDLWEKEKKTLYLKNSYYTNLTKNDDF